ncbi:hypothetical protein HJC23_008389 [Cyclotella cryptica]|uniref:Uncharacterized protein n=1 Tax=Cyclotella cryptica TaxID=29204 RepID=A0ABD3PIX7_9STRA
MTSSRVKAAITAGVLIAVLIGAAVSTVNGVLKSLANSLIVGESPAIGRRNLSPNLHGDGSKHIGRRGMPRETKALRLKTRSSFWDPKTVEQKPVSSVAGSFPFDPETIRHKKFEDVLPFLEDGTYLLFTDLRFRGPNTDCRDIVNQQDRINRIHYHVASCSVFDNMFGNRLALVYGIRMIANALRKPFTFTCELSEGETPNGAAYLMELNNAQSGALGPVPSRNGEEYTAEDLCRSCANSFCNWHDRNLDMASDIMISDWKQLTRPGLVPIPDHDDAVIHLRLGDGLYSTRGGNEGKGIFPHATYINLLKRAQEEKGAISSIGIVTSPFKGSNVQVWDAGVTSISEAIALDLVKILQSKFPHATIRLHNSPEGTIIESQARLVHARKVAICGCSTFCPYTVLATEGIGFIYNPVGAQNIWVRNAAERYRNFRLFEAPLLNGLMIANKKSGWMLHRAHVLGWVRKQNPNVGNVDIFEEPIFRAP